MKVSQRCVIISAHGGAAYGRIDQGDNQHKKLVIAVFLIAMIISAVLVLGVQVNYDLTDYLPEDSESTVALDLMYAEFGSGVPIRASWCRS